MKLFSNLQACNGSHYFLKVALAISFFAFIFGYSNAQILPDSLIKDTYIDTSTYSSKEEGVSMLSSCSNTPQWAQIGSSDDIYKCNPSGKVGIGTSSPTTILDVVTLGLSNGIRANSSLYPNARYIDIASTAANYISATNDLYLRSLYAAVVLQPAAQNKYIHAQGNLLVTSGNKVGIGTGTLTHELNVKGKIGACEVLVESTWCDYVFNDDYNLRSIDEVENFIKENRHLPGIPPEKTIAENGLNLGDMQKMQMEKIEELTLYLIQQQKEIEQLKKEILVLQNGLK